MATHIYAFHGGTSEDDGLKSRPRVWEVSHGADQIARHVARERTWTASGRAKHRQPKVHFGPIAAGEVVLNSRISGHAGWIRRHYNDALAVEMEGAGVAQAAHLNRSLPVVVIRGVSDRADGTKEATDRERWQPRAVVNAAAFTAALAESLTTDEANHRRPETTRTTGSRQMDDTVRNIAKDNARVGVQAGHVHGGVQLSTDKAAQADPSAALADLIARLEQARDAGVIDEDTHRAARAELDDAREALHATPRNLGAVTLALKKVRGLVADVAALAAEVASVLGFVRNLS